MRETTTLILLLLIGFSLYAEPPDWQVDAENFTHNKNLSAQLFLNDILNNDPDNIIAAFVNGEVRGVATGILVGSEVYYFMSVYSSSPNTDTLSFKVYLQSEDDTFDIEETIPFSNINPSYIYELNSYLNIDQPISLIPFGDQNQVEGFEFDSIYLPDYLVQVDDDPIIWTYTGNSNLQVNINDDWLIVKNTAVPPWIGTETLTITATEQTTNAYEASTTINYTSLPDYGAPDWNTVDDQKIGLNQTFRSFDLDESLFTYPGSSLAYHYFMPQASGTAPNENWSFSAKNFQYSMNVTAFVRYGSTDHDNLADRLLAYNNGQLVGITAPQTVNGQVIYFLSVYSDINNIDINFKLYDAEYQQLYELPDILNFQNGSENGTPDNPLIFNTAPLEVVLNSNGTVLMNIEKSGWIGTQEIAFIAYDTFQPLINADTTYADFTVVNEHAPEIAGIPDQYVELGTPFSVIKLESYYTEFDGNNVDFSVIGANNLNFNVNSKGDLSISSPDPMWTGSETIDIRITDATPCGLYNEQQVTFTIGAPNQAPDILVIPEQIIEIGDTFPKLDLNNFLNEPNNDPVSWTYFQNVQNLGMANPGWTINPGSFQFSMTMTAQVDVRAGINSAAGHQLAAFYDGELRGIATASEVAGDWYYFLNIYSNQSQDSIYFEYYDPDQNAVFAIDDSIKFISQQQIGTLSDPYIFKAGYIDPQANNNILCPSVIDQDWLGSDTIFVIATETSTFEKYKDTAQIIFTVQATEVSDHTPQLSGIPDQYRQKGTAFDSFNLDDFLTEEDNDSTFYSVSGMTNFSVDIDTSGLTTLSILDPNWIGTETLTFRVTDVTSNGLFGEQQVDFTVGPNNTAPIFAELPDQIIGLGDTFPDLNLQDYLTNAEGDEINFTYFQKAIEEATVDPAWSLNTSGFTKDMNIFAQVEVRKDYPIASGHQLAAFSDGDLRGLATAQEISGTWFFNLEIFAKKNGDSIYFEYYDPDQNVVFAIDQSISFLDQQQLGNINTPFDLKAGFVNPQTSGALISTEVIDTDWLGTDTLYVIVEENSTFEKYRDTATIAFRVQATSPILPVDLISFTARPQDNQSVLDWSIANPDNLLAFQIQSAIEENQNGDLDWSELGVQNFEVNEMFYRFIDASPFLGKNYYRLKIIDRDGTFEYSPTVTVEFERDPSRVKLYPNPAFNKVIYLNITTEQQDEINLQIIDATGRIWQQQNLQAQSNRAFITLDIHNFPTGKYFARVKINNLINSIPFVILGN